MKILQSIQAVQKVFETNGSRPVLVKGRDLNDYVCKYYNGYKPANLLRNEYLASSFLKCWQLKTPDIAFVKIVPQHISAKILDSRIQKRFFDCYCFGSKYIASSKEIDRSWEDGTQFKKKKFADLETYLRLILFDLWIANEDRNPNNYNLLLSKGKKGYHFYAIDHTFCFNTNSLDHDLYELSFEETLFYSPITRILFPDSKIALEVAKMVLRNFEIYVSACKQNTSFILQQIPRDWGIDANYVKERLDQTIFTKEWLERVSVCYHNYLHQTYS